MKKHKIPKELYNIIKAIRDTTNKIEPPPEAEEWLEGYRAALSRAIDLLDADDG